MEETPAFLTETRRDILNGEYTGQEGTERSHKSKIKARSRTALQELIEVAQSPEIDNSDIFEPDDLARLVDALMVPDGGLTPRWNFEGSPESFRAEYQYQIGLHARLRHSLNGYDDMLHKNTPPGEQPNWSG